MVLLECLPFFYPFGNTPAHNAFEGFEIVSEEPAGEYAADNR